MLLTIPRVNHILKTMGQGERRTGGFSFGGLMSNANHNKIEYFEQAGIQYRRPDGDGIPSQAGETYHLIDQYYLMGGPKFIKTFPLIVASGDVHKLINHWNQQGSWKYVLR